MSWTGTKTLELYGRYCEIAERLNALSAQEDWAAVGTGLAALSVLAEGGALEAAEALAEYYAFQHLSGPHQDNEKAYKWYYLAFEATGSSVAFNNQSLSESSYLGVIGDFRNEAVVSELVEGIGLSRVQTLDHEAAAWLDQHGRLRSLDPRTAASAKA
jgi:hypothetical protein